MDAACEITVPFISQMFAAPVEVLRQSRSALSSPLKSPDSVGRHAGVSGVRHEERGVENGKGAKQEENLGPGAEDRHVHLAERADELAPLSPDVPPVYKRLEVYLPDQVLVAYEYNDPVFVTICWSTSSIASALPKWRLIPPVSTWLIIPFSKHSIAKAIVAPQDMLSTPYISHTW